MNCPTCNRPMRNFAGRWVCLNIKAPEHRKGTRSGGGRGGDRRSGKHFPGTSRHGKKKGKGGK